MSLKDLTIVKHKEAEKKEFNQRMFRGELTTEEYVKYLTSQLAIFSEIEKFKLPNVSLLRKDKILEDLKELQNNILDESPLTNSNTTKYVEYLSKLNNETITPHVYLNYLALVYGGQMIKKMVPGSGKMYEFENVQESIDSIRSIQKDEWADEVNNGFDFIINILDELQGLSK
jgi:heme oxygenase